MATTTTGTSSSLVVGQKVLCRIDGYNWFPGVIVSVREHIHAVNDLVLPGVAPLRFIPARGAGGNADEGDDDEDEDAGDHNEDHDDDDDDDD